MDGSFANDFAGTPRFEVIARIGEGAVGVVYAALDREQNAPVALKTLRAPTPEAILLIKTSFVRSRISGTRISSTWASSSRSAGSGSSRWSS